MSCDYNWDNSFPLEFWDFSSGMTTGILLIVSWWRKFLLSSYLKLPTQGMEAWGHPSYPWWMVYYPSESKSCNGWEMLRWHGVALALNGLWLSESFWCNTGTLRKTRWHIDPVDSHQGMWCHRGHVDVFLTLQNPERGVTDGQVLCNSFLWD